MILKLTYIIYSKSAKITLSVCVAVGKFVCYCCSFTIVVVVVVVVVVVAMSMVV